jgi:hypothetical protein
MEASATTDVWLSNDRVVVSGYSQGPVAWNLDGDVTVVAANASDTELGAAVMEMLERPAKRVQEPAQRPLLSAARVRSFRQLEREYALVSVERDGATLRFDAWEPEGGGMVPMIELQQQLDALAPDHTLIGRVTREIAQRSVFRPTR